MTYEITNPIREDVFGISEKVIAFFEDCHLAAYPDPLSKAEPFTIGFGNTAYEDGVKVERWHEISKTYAYSLLWVTIIRGWSKLEKTIPGWHRLNVGQQAALLSFGFNLGYNFYGAEGFNTISNVLSDEDKEANMLQVFRLYRNEGSNVELGLYRRRIAESILWHSGNINDAKAAKDLSMEQCQSFNIVDYLGMGHPFRGIVAEVPSTCSTGNCRIESVEAQFDNTLGSPTVSPDDPTHIEVWGDETAWRDGDELPTSKVDHSQGYPRGYPFGETYQAAKEKTFEGNAQVQPLQIDHPTIKETDII